MVLIRQNEGAKIILHAKWPTFRAAKLKGFTVHGLEHFRHLSTPMHPGVCVLPYSAMQQWCNTASTAAITAVSTTVSSSIDVPAWEVVRHWRWQLGYVGAGPVTQFVRWWADYSDAALLLCCVAGFLVSPTQAPLLTMYHITLISMTFTAMNTERALKETRPLWSEWVSV